MGKNFIFLNVIQFLDAMNENLLKYLVAYFLIFYQGKENSSLIMSTTGAVFVLPFIFFSSVGGVLADLYSKTRVIQMTRLCHIVVMSGAFIFSLFFTNQYIYLILFVSCAITAIFGPCKYGIIAEIAPKNQLVKANGYVAGFTYFGIIVGTALASMLDGWTRSHFPVMFFACVAFSLIGTLCSFFMDRTVPMAPDRPWPKFIYKEVADALAEMSHIPEMLMAVFCYGYFVFVGAFIQMNIIPYSINILGVKETIGGYLFLCTSVGVGLGCLIAGKFSGTLRMLPWWGIGMSIGCFFFMLFPFPIWLNIVWLAAAGVFGGLFLVPPQAYIVAESPAPTKGRNFGVANLFSFVFALLAAGALYLLSTVLGLNSSQSFGWIGAFNLVVSLGLFFLTRPKSVVH